MRRTRPLLVALGRGLLSVLANPGLLLAQLALVAGRVATLVLTVAALLVPFAVAAGLQLSLDRVPDLSGLERLLDGGEQTLVPLLAAAGVALVLSSVVLGGYLALSGVLHAGLAGVLVASDRRAPEGAPVDRFRVDGARRLFVASARAGFLRFTGLVTVLVHAALVPVFLLAVAVGVLVWAIQTDHVALGVAVLLAALVVAVAAGFLVQLGFLGAAWGLAAAGMPLRPAIGAGLRLVLGSLGRSLGLFLLLALAGGAAGGVLSVPRLLGALAGEAASPPLDLVLVPLSLVAVLVQLVVLAAVEVVQLGAFLSLWNGPGPAVPPARIPPRVAGAPEALP